MALPKALRGSYNAYGGTDNKTKRQSDWRDQVATWLGRLLLISAVWSFLTIGLFGHGMRVIGEIGADLLGMANIPSEPSLLVVCTLLVLAGAIRRRLRAAHTVVLVLMAFNVFGTFAVLATGFDKDFHPSSRITGFSHDYLVLRNSLPFNAVALVVGVAALVLVWRSRPVFVARLAPHSGKVAVGVLAAGMLATFGITAILTFVFPRTLSGPGEMVIFALRSTFGIATPPDTPGFSGRLGHLWIYSLAGFLSAIALIVALLALWRSSQIQQHTTADEELAIRRLLLEYGEDDSLGYFATRRDKTVIFSPDGQAAVTYRVQGSVSVASADPIGRRSSWPAAIEAWITQCREYGLYAAVLSSSEEGTAYYVDAGLKAWSLGDEAIIDTERFSLRGAEMKPVRQALTRITRAGYTSRVCRHGDLSEQELQQIGQLAERWRGNETERGFSMALNRLGDPSDGRCVIITATDKDGQIRGFLSFVPWGVRGISLDLMRRDRDAENGLNEYMVAKLVESAEEIGIRRISLNFAVFRNVFADADQIGAGPVTRITDKALSFASRFFQLESLYRSNDKYHPNWVPRLLCYDPQLTVPRAGLAMAVAEGFVPFIGPRFLIGPRPSDIQPPRQEADFVERVHNLEDDLLIPQAPPAELNEQQRVRRDKVNQLLEANMPAYAVQVPRTDRAFDVVRRHTGMAPDTLTDDVVSLTGRVRAWRDLGGIGFAVLEDGATRIQVMVDKCRTPVAARNLWRRTVDLGDVVSVTGPVGTSRNGEISIVLRSWQMAAKCLSPMPRLGTVLSDDVRTRQRSLDLIVTPGSLDMLTRRSLAVRAIRNVFEEHGFLEVETPMLHQIHGGATARPFRTHINAYNMDLYLRIAPELYLKRLAVGGMQKIFEVGRNFRNEGADATHNPEFTSCEAYEAYGDYNTMRELQREVILAVATAVNGRPVALRPNDAGGVDEIDLTAPWPVKTIHEAVSEAVGRTITTDTTKRELIEICRGADLPIKPEDPAGKLVMELYEAFVEKQTSFPTFYYDFPVEVSFLARRHRTNPALTEQWDLVAFGAEMGTAYSELNDPIDQRERLTKQSMAAAAGDPEAMELDEAFLRALELGLPPTGGIGFGVDRLVMMLTGTNIKATLAFPFVRPQGESD